MRKMYEPLVDTSQEEVQSLGTSCKKCNVTLTKLNWQLCLQKINYNVCSLCRKKINLQWKEQNKEKTKEYTKTYYNKNKNKCLEANQKYISENREKVNLVKRGHTSKRKSLLLKRVPSWANLKQITSFYRECPPGYHVDHIIPLQGKFVSGLHVENNLQYLPAKENLSKGNKYNGI